MSDKDVPLEEEVYGTSPKWDLDHLPPITNDDDHIVLYEFPINTSITQPPKPFFGNGEPKWDTDHVKLPCSTHNEFEIRRTNDPNETVHIKRWGVIIRTFLRDIRSVKDLQEAILTYNREHSKEWNFKALQSFLKAQSKAFCDVFFNRTLPNIIRLALQLPTIVPCSIPLLKTGENKSISLSQQQIACLLANAFLCTFPHRDERFENSEYFAYPTINFGSLFSTIGNDAKLACVINYFMSVFHKMPTGVVTFARRSLRDEDLPDWDGCEVTFANTHIHVSSKGTIEDDSDGLLQVDFANKLIGGPVLDGGCVQEEIRFMINPELLCSRLFTEILGDNECMTIVGCQRFNAYQGYGPSFRWAGCWTDTTPIDSFRRRRSAIVAIDATPFPKRSAQFKEDMLRRELNKAYIGFKHHLATEAPAVATGNWGCGVYNGNKYLKSLLQLMACCATNRPLVYYTFGDKTLCQDLLKLHEYLSKKNVKIANVWSYLTQISKSSKWNLYKFLIDCLENEKSDPEVNANEMFSNSPSQLDVTATLEDNSQREKNSSKASMSHNTHSIDDDDEEFAVDEATEMERSYNSRKPQLLKLRSSKPLSEKDKSTAIEITSDSEKTTEIRGKRTRSLQVGVDDEILPAKMNRALKSRDKKSPTFGSVSFSYRSTNRSTPSRKSNLKEKKADVIMVDESETDEYIMTSDEGQLDDGNNESIVSESDMLIYPNDSIASGNSNLEEKDDDENVTSAVVESENDNSKTGSDEEQMRKGGNDSSQSESDKMIFPVE